MRIIRWRTNRNGFGCSTISVAQIVRYLFQLVGSKLFAVLDLIQDDRVMSRLCLIRALETCRNENLLGLYLRYQTMVHVPQGRSPILAPS